MFFLCNKNQPCFEELLENVAKICPEVKVWHHKNLDGLPCSNLEKELFLRHCSGKNISCHY